MTTPDIGRLMRVLRKAEKTKRVLPQGNKELWVTEFWYDTDPPDPTGVSLALRVGNGYEFISQAGL